MASSNSNFRSKRQQERRIKERRAIEYEFGSPEWITRIQKENLLWPKQDRRQRDRRAGERRQDSVD